MEESRASFGIGMSLYNGRITQAIVDRERYFNECIQRELNRK